MHQMISLLRAAWHIAEARLKDKGYAVTWHPPSALAEAATLAWSFELVAAHLMLKKKDVFFIEIGANNGVANDPIYPFASLHGWQGIALEPQPAVFGQLLENYRHLPGVKCVNAAIGHQNGMATFYSVKPDSADNGLHWAMHQLSSFSRETVLRRAGQFPGLAASIQEEKVATLSWESIVALAGSREIDVLHIDTEGFDAAVIRMIDFEKNRPWIVHYEHCNLSKADQEDCARRLTAEGYRLAANSFDVIAYRWSSIGAAGKLNQM